MFLVCINNFSLSLEKELYSETLQSVEMTMLDSSYLDSVGISCLPPIASNTTVSLLYFFCLFFHL